MPPKKSKRSEDKAADDVAPEPEQLLEQRSGTVTEASVLVGTVPFIRKTQDSDFDSKKMYKIISWNVAGLRALLKKSKELHELAEKEKPDFLCLQETKLSPDEEAYNAKLGVLENYTFYDSWSVAKKGYSGTRIYVRKDNEAQVTEAMFGFNVDKPQMKDDEGRVVALVFGPPKAPLVLVNSYVPNAGMELDRLDYRVKHFDPLMRGFLSSLALKKKCNIIWTGDLNVAERDYDRFFSSNWKQMQKAPGFTPEERTSFRTTLREVNLFDAFRHVYPTAHKVYSFWSARFNQRPKNNGWRLDYFVLSTALASKLVDCFMLPQYTGSDHCPVALWLNH